MTPKEKALELYNKFEDGITGVEGTDWWISAEKCALIAVDEILNVLPQKEYLEDKSKYIENRERLYWQEVKQEIEKL
jgi:hypothetical protein